MKNKELEGKDSKKYILDHLDVMIYDVLFFYCYDLVTYKFITALSN